MKGYILKEEVNYNFMILDYYYFKL